MNVHMNEDRRCQGANDAPWCTFTRRKRNSPSSLQITKGPGRLLFVQAYGWGTAGSLAPGCVATTRQLRDRRHTYV